MKAGQDGALRCREVCVIVMFCSSPEKLAHQPAARISGIFIVVPGAESIRLARPAQTTGINLHNDTQSLKESHGILWSSYISGNAFSVSDLTEELTVCSARLVEAKHHDNTIICSCWIPSRSSNSGDSIR